MNKIEILEDLIGTKIVDIKRKRIPYKERDPQLNYYGVNMLDGNGSILSIEIKVVYNFHSTIITIDPIQKLENKTVYYIGIPTECLEIFYRSFRFYRNNLNKCI